MPEPTIEPGDNRLLRTFASNFPHEYLRRFGDEGFCAGGLHEPINVLSERARFFDRVEEDARSGDPAMCYQNVSVHNCVFEIVICSSASTVRYMARIYTVQSGTHRGKRLVKVRTANGYYKAAGFLNRDSSFTPWNNSPWSEDTILHLAIADFLHRVTVRRDLLNQDLLPGQDGITVWFAMQETACIRCNAVIRSGERLCDEHMPAENVGVDGVTIFQVEGAAERRARLWEERRVTRDRQERDRQHQLAVEREQEQQRQQEEALASFTPLLSENGTGAIR